MRDWRRQAWAEGHSTHASDSHVGDCTHELNMKSVTELQRNSFRWNSLCQAQVGSVETMECIEGHA